MKNKTKEFETIIGIDPGLGGAITIIKFDNMVTMKMPKTISEIMDVLKDHTKPIVFIERVSHWGFEDGAKKFAIAKLMKQYTTLKNVIDILQLPYVECGAPTWQKRLNIPKIKNETYAARKKRLWGISQQMVPNMKVLKPTADAILIAVMGKRAVEYDMDWIKENRKQS